VTHPVVHECLSGHLRGLGAELVTTAGGNDLVVGLDAPPSGPAAAAYRQVRLPFKRRQLAALLRDSAPAAEPVTPVSNRPAVRSARVTLLADDDALARRVSSALLQRAGCNVTAVEGGHAALAALGSTAFDLIVLDGQMGDIDGWEVAAHLRKGRAGELNRHTPIIALSADLTAEAQQRWQDGGVTAFLPKPLQVEKLQTCLDALSSSAETTV
jgi:CheY-like chemotaxis protein